MFWQGSVLCSITWGRAVCAVMSTQMFSAWNTYAGLNLELALKIFLSPAFVLNFFCTDFMLLFNPICTFCLFLPNTCNDLHFFLQLFILGLEPQFRGLGSSGSAPGLSLQAVLTCLYVRISSCSWIFRPGRAFVLMEKNNILLRYLT